MKLLGSGVVFSTDNNDLVPSLFHFSEAALFGEKMAIDYAVAASQMALDNAYYAATDIDLIISISISPSHLSDSPNIIGPRLGHPLQRELKAKNAIVLDLLAADWSFAIDVAYGFCLSQSLSTALIVRAESTTGVAGGNDNLVPLDGSGALLLGLPQYNTWRVAYKDINIPKAEAVPSNSEIAIKNDVFLSRYFCLGASATPLINAAVKNTIEQLIDIKKLNDKSFICESLADGNSVAPLIKELGGQLFEHDISKVGSFGLPLTLAMWQLSPGAETEAYCLSFDPFKARQACYLLEM